MTREPDDDLVPVSVRLGAVVPPEDPEDWTRPLTWVAALGMLAGPLVALGWFVFASPTTSVVVPGRYLVAAAIAAGAALTGSTQQGTVRAWTATLGAGLFGALGVVVVSVLVPDEPWVGYLPHAVDHAVMAVLAGLGGTAAAAIGAAAVGRSRSRRLRVIVPTAVGAVGALGAVWLLG